MNESAPARSRVRSAPHGILRGCLILFLTGMGLPVDTPRTRFWEAWAVLEVERRPRAARVVFDALVNEGGLPRVLHARALLHRAQCDWMVGRTRQAEQELREIQGRYPDLPELMREVEEALAQVGGGRTRFAASWVTLDEGQALDLDSGGIFHSRDAHEEVVGELSVEQGTLRFRTLPEIDPEPAQWGAQLADSPWQRLTTDRGRLAWVQILETGDVHLVRTLVRRAGFGPLRPAPAGLMAVGHGDWVELWFDQELRFARYRVERRLGRDGPWTFQEEVESAPFQDRSVRAGVRYGYRVTGVSANGDESASAQTQATVLTRGVTAGRCTLPREGRVSVDLLQGHLTEGDGDLTLVVLHPGGEAATFADGFGRRRLRRLPTVPPPRRRPKTWLETFPTDLLERPFPGTSGGDAFVTQQRAGEWFLIPLRGGGGALCRWRLVVDPESLELEYFVYPDSLPWPAGPGLTFGEQDRYLDIDRTTTGDGQVAEVVKRDLLGGKESSLVVKEGQAHDPRSGQSDLVRYEAVAQDRRGRRTLPTRIFRCRLPEGTRQGEVVLRHVQGYSFERGRLVPPGQADLVFQGFDLTSGWVELQAPRGQLVSVQQVLESASEEHPSRTEREQARRLLRRLRHSGITSGVVGQALLDVSGALPLQPRVRCRPDLPASCVLIVRTRNGGWVRVIVSLGSGVDRPLHLQYVYNAYEPLFDATHPVQLSLGALRLRSIETSAAAGEEPSEPFASVGRSGSVATSVEELVETLHDLQTAWRQRLRAQGEPESSVGVVAAHDLVRKLGGDPSLARSLSGFAFRAGSGADGSPQAADVDFRYGSQRPTLDLYSVVDDRGAAFDLGAVDYWLTAPPALVKPAPPRRVPVHSKHVYVIHSEDRDTDRWTILQVLEAEPYGALVFRYRVLEDPGPWLPLERRPERMLTRGPVRLQLSSGRGGFNAQRLFLHGKTNTRIDVVESEPLRWWEEIPEREPTRAFVTGGYIPEGRVFVVERIEYKVQCRAGMDRARCRLEILGQEVLRMEGTGQVVSGKREGDWRIAPGEEGQVFLEITQYTQCDVVLHGRLRRARDLDRRR